MKVIPVIMVSGLLVMTAARVQDGRPAVPMDAARGAGYAIGHDLGIHTLARIHSDGVTIDRDMLIQGFSDAVREVDPMVEAVDMEATLARLEREVSTRLAAERIKEDPVFKALADDNAERGRVFCETFEQREGVITLPSGIRYIEMTNGSGRRPTLEDTIVASYEGSLVDGYVFARETEKSFRVGGVLSGGREVIQQMQVGDRWRVVIPAALAYGLGGRAPDIGPNETVLFDITLVGIK